MKKLISLVFIAFLISCSGVAQKSEKKVAKKYAVSKTASEWKKQLTSLQYYVLREAGTERSFTSSLNENKKMVSTYVQLVKLLFMILIINLILEQGGLLLIELL